MALVDFPLYRLGWKAFQDLCVAIVEEQIQRPVQTFIPTNDAGRDGAFRGSWDGADYGESTIQCKFTSQENATLSISHLLDELAKAQNLAAKNLASDYVIMTNCRVTGQSELQIKAAFQAVGVGNCRVFHRNWVTERVHRSPRLRMMVPRLYGLLELSGLLDERAYRQAQLILSEMGDNLQKLVVTEAYRKSVRAISEYGLVLLLGSPAAGKSTIGASLALGASHTWNSSTIKSTSPIHLERHIDPAGGQFFWIDDAWGSTQYQRERTEAWNQVFPLMQGAIRHGTKFLITSRDYIWSQAKRELKLQALPVLKKSQVVINVHELTIEEKARILYNHIKLGDQPTHVRTQLKSLHLLPYIAKRSDFLPESARRLGTALFTEQLSFNALGVADFFARPKDFLEETIANLASECRAAIALVFLNGGLLRSPVSAETVERPAEAFGVAPSAIRSQLEALNGSLLNLIEDEGGPYWTYRHPTVADAFASYVAKSPELVEIYLRGARPETLAQEVVCAGVSHRGAAVTVPNSLQEILADKIGNLPSQTLVSFISYRSNEVFSRRIMALRPDMWKRIEYFSVPLNDDVDVDFFIILYKHGLISQEQRVRFVDTVRQAAVDDADSSFLDHDGIRALLTDEERQNLLEEVDQNVLNDLERHVDRIRDSWDKDYDPDDHFDQLRSSIKAFATAISAQVPPFMNILIRSAVDSMREEYEPVSTSSAAPTQQSAAKTDSLDDLFRDVDD